MPDLRVVVAEPADLGTYLDFLEGLADWLHARGIQQWPPGNFRSSPGYFGESIARREVHLAYVGENLAGAIRLLMRDPIVWPEIRDDNGVYIYNLAVARAWAGHDLGARLLEWASTRTVLLGRTHLRLDCMAGNAFLQRYYEHAGFEPRGDVDAVYPAPVGTLRLSRYEKRVTEF